VYGGRAPDQGALDHACERVGLSAAQRATRADALPTGIRQRAALAAATAHGPELLFLDEPTSGVDPRSRKVFWDLIRELASGGTTVLVTTHAMGEAQGCERVALMAAGRIVAIGTPGELIDGTGSAIVAVQASPWQQAYERIHGRWPDAALYGRSAHIPTADADAVAAEVRQLLSGLEVAAVTVQRPTPEGAFVWHIGRAYG
jgi:ABC-2 type transport system ATP-binding protein